MSEQINRLKPRKALNKAFLKVKPNRTEIEGFKTNLIQLIDRTNDTESEEFHKNLIIDFLKKTYYEPKHYINTKGRNDLVIHNAGKATSSVGVILEAKKPTNKSEMASAKNINTKAFQELVLYYLRERITNKNLEVKHLVITNIHEWFIFDATLFDRFFAQNKNLVKQFNDFEGGRLAETKTDFFYKQIAEPFIAAIKTEIEFTYFNLQDYQIPLRNADKKDDNKLIALFKLLSPEHLLKLPFTNDSNSLDKRFYSELLHIIGLTETKEGSKKLIGRNKVGERNSGSLLEDAIIHLDSLDKINRLEKPSQFGDTQEERLFNLALELSITWINRILFLKLLEAQLITYQKGDQSYAFLNLDKIKNYDDLNGLFFQVLAKQYEERNEDVKQLFEKVPYLNSSLFEPTEIEQLTLFISNLRDEKTIPIISSTVLKNEQGKKRTGKLSTLEYLFEFLNAYDFSSEGSEEIQEDNKTLINASVLGLIFEKINGYKDGSFFTPGFITMYMCRETIRKAVIQKFNQTKKWNCNNIEELYDKIEDRKEANEIVNSIKICDPAVGSGHFLVSALNEMIAIKNDLKILQDRDGKRLKEYQVEVVNDELIVTDEEGELFEYNPSSKESQRIQETLFHEKQTIIESCLFGVDINQNSVKICRLRLWIELLKNAYYTKSSPPSKGVVPEGGGGLKLNNLPYLKTFRKENRNNSTPAEAKLWTLLKGKQMEGRKFRRQHSVANYILDFYCPQEKIAIELDGQGHFEATQAEYDQERDLFLQNFGIRVLRFENKWVWDNLDGLLDEVKSYFGKQPPRQPQADTPPSKGGELRELQTLPNIDINIKCGNSLVSRFDIDADIKKALKKSKWTIDSYRVAVATYRNAESKAQKRAMEKLIADIKSDFRSEISLNDPKAKRLRKLSGELFQMTQQTQLFEMSKKEKAAWNKKVAKLTQDSKKLEAEIEAIKANKIYENAFEWRFEFPEVLNDDGDFVGFDVVIGNPPYIRVQNLEHNVIDYYKGNYESFYQKADIYLLFIEKAISLLKKNSGLSFINPTLFMSSNYGQGLREFLTQYRISRIVDFGDLPIFEEAITYTGIFFIYKANPNNIEFKKIESLSNIIETLNDSSFESFNQGNFGKENWVLRNDKHNNLLNKLQTFQNLGSIAVVNSGCFTGYDKAFFVDDETINKYQLEEEVIKPVIMGKEPKKYNLHKPVKKCIYPYKSGSNDETQIIEEQLFKASFPNCYKYLLNYKKELENRMDSRKTFKEMERVWYSYTRKGLIDIFNEEKILVGYIVSKNTYCLDENGYMFSVGRVFAIQPIKKQLTEPILGILNSNLSEFLMTSLCPIKQGGFFKISSQYLNSFPVPKLDNEECIKIKKLVNQILSIKKQDPSADTSSLEKEIDQLVYTLYDLTEEEIGIVENFTK